MIWSFPYHPQEILLSEYFFFQDESDQVDGVAHAELGQDSFAVPVDGLRAEAEAVGRLRIGQTVADQPQDVALYGCEGDHPLL